MSPDNEDPPVDMSDAEKVIRALEALVAECDARQLIGFSKRIQLCLSKCQTDYIVLQRRRFAERIRQSRKPPDKMH